MSALGEYRKDGSFVGFDYDAKYWIDTAPYAKRDDSFPQGSASNPLPHALPPIPKFSDI